MEASHPGLVNAMTNRQSNGRLPDFLIAGAQKAGSTWLARNLAQHPDIFMPPREIHFFDIDANYQRGLDWYADHFSGASANQVIGEKTPNYLQIYRGSRTVPIAQRIRSHLPTVKLFFVLRDPVKRALSALRHHMFFRRLPATATVDDILFGKFREQAEKWNILTGGLYARNINEYLNIFSSKNIKILIFEEDIRLNAPDTLAECLGFIGCPSNNNSLRLKDLANVGMRSRFSFMLNEKFPIFSNLWQFIDRRSPHHWDLKPDPNCLMRLHEYYRDENECLFEMIGRGIKSWDIRLN